MLLELIINSIAGPAGTLIQQALDAKAAIAGSISQAFSAASLNVAGATSTGSLSVSGQINETSKAVIATAALTTFMPAARNNYLTGTAGASFAITLPAAAASIDGAKILVLSTADRVSTTWASTGATGGIIGAPAALAANVGIMLHYDHASLAWYITN